MELKVKYEKMTNAINLDAKKVAFADCADHVCIARSTLSNSVSFDKTWSQVSNCS